MTFKVLILTLFMGSSLAQLVTTPDGPIQGVEEQSTAGKTYYAYYSIPYAKPPIGSRRFLASEQVDPWTETHNGTQEKPSVCYQLYTDSEHETEDCLYLNVFTPQNPNSSVSENYTVIVYIHEGGFYAGSGLVSNGISPNYLINEDVIFVSLNYRLGAFGFLSTNDEVIPGNAGLSDQIQALSWVQRNIAAFGGDPDKVTVLGQAAGASSVGYLMMTPAATGLFSAAIIVSGTCLVPWSYQRQSEKYAFKLGSFVNAEFDSNLNSSALLETLQNADADAIDNATTNLTAWIASQPDAAGNSLLQRGQYFAPVLDRSSATPMVNETQFGSLRLGSINPVPILIGGASEEGLITLIQNMDGLLQEYDNNSAYLVPQAMRIDNEEVLAEVGSLIKQEYSPNSTFLDNKLAGIQYFSEQNLDKSIVKHAELQSQFSFVFFFQFAYTGQMGGNTDQKYPGSGNVTHGEDIKYILNTEDLSSYPENDQLVSRRLVRLWTNFAKYNDPTPGADDLLQDILWPRVYPNDFKYVRIGDFYSTNLTVVQGKPKAARMAFWDHLYSTYALRPFDTY